MSGTPDQESLQFEVQGLPPLKNEALSLFSERHGHHREVRALLGAAQNAAAGTTWDPATRKGLALTVKLRVPAGVRTGDATNYLGGIGDVLESKSKRSLPHLGELAAVQLFENDAQIEEVHFTRSVGEPGYTVILAKR